MFQNVAYRLTVYKTGADGDLEIAAWWPFELDSARFFSNKKNVVQHTHGTTFIEYVSFAQWDCMSL